MASSEVDQKLLGRLCSEVAATNPLLSSALYQVLGLSVLLSRKLFRARKLRKLDPTRDTKSVSLYHQIIWLSREGLSITEVYILPYCQNGSSGPHCRVMAARLRASFYHVLCLFHNHPPISQLSPISRSPTPGPLTPRANNGQVVRRQSPAKSSRERKAALRDAIPSMTSEASYITNPFALDGPAQSPPPSYPVPPLPNTTFSSRMRTPVRPPGLSNSSVQTSPTSSASYLLPPVNFIPAAKGYFTTASSLARDLLPGSDPLRLSAMLEHSAFLWDCAREYDAAKILAKSAIRDVYAAPEGMDDTEFEDAASLVKSLGLVARRGDSAASTSPHVGQEEEGNTDTVGRWQATGVTSRNTARSSFSRSTNTTSRSRQRMDSAQSTGRQVNIALTPEDENALSGRSTTLIGTPVTGATIAIEHQDKHSSTDYAKRTRAESKSKQRRRSPSRGLSDKERKRKLVEKAEEEFIRRNSASTTGGSRQATPPHMVGAAAAKARDASTENFNYPITRKM